MLLYIFYKNAPSIQFAWASLREGTGTGISVAFHGLQTQCNLSSGETQGAQQNEIREAPK